MRRISTYFLGLTLIAMGIGSNPQDKPTAQAARAPATVATRPQAEFLEEIAYYEQRYVRRAESEPAAKYAWRPVEGVRSIGEVYTHMVAANFRSGLLAGDPATVDFKSIKAMSTDEARLSDADADKPQKMFGRQTTLQGSFLLITGHFGANTWAVHRLCADERRSGALDRSTTAATKQAEKPKS